MFEITQLLLINKPKHAIFQTTEDCLYSLSCMIPLAFLEEQSGDQFERLSLQVLRESFCFCFVKNKKLSILSAHWSKSCFATNSLSLTMSKFCLEARKAASI